MGKLLVIAGFVRSIYSKWLFQRLLSGILVIAALSLVMTILAGAAVAVGFYALYVTMLHHGIEQEVALALMSLLMFAICAVLLKIILRSVGKLRSIPRGVMKTKLPVAGKAGDVINSFIEGLLAD